MASKKSFVHKQHEQTPGLHTIVPNRLSEIAYWWLRNANDKFTTRQIKSNPMVYNRGESPRNYLELAKLMPPENKPVGNIQSIPDAMRLGLLLEAISTGCQSQELLDAIMKEVGDQSSMLNRWIVTVHKLQN